jgi:hypothetical protein
MTTNHETAASGTNDLVDLMREFGVEVRMLGTDEEPSPTGVALADMLTEIHTLRSRISAERHPVSDRIARNIWLTLTGRMPNARLILEYDLPRVAGRPEEISIPLDADDFTSAVRAAIGPAVPVSDEELVDILQRARSLYHFGESGGFVGPRNQNWMAGMVAGIRAVRNALGPAVPVIPSEWWIDSINSIRHWDRSAMEMVIERYDATIATYDEGTIRFCFGSGDDPDAALTAAIAQIPEGGNEG